MPLKEDDFELIAKWVDKDFAVGLPYDVITDESGKLMVVVHKINDLCHKLEQREVNIRKNCVMCKKYNNGSPPCKGCPLYSYGFGDK